MKSPARPFFLIVIVLLALTATGAAQAAPASTSTSNAAQQATVSEDRIHWPSPVMDKKPFELLLFDNFESQGTGAFHWDMYGWRGGDYQRLWVKSEGSQATDNTASDADVQLLYGKLILPFTDLQLGGRVASVWGNGSRTSRVFAVLGLQSTTPYGFDIEPALFLSNKGKLSARFTGTFDVLLSQKLVLQPRVETNLAAQADREFRSGSGFNDLEAGTRLRYEIRREFAPYIGVIWGQNFGETKTLRRLYGADEQGFSVVFGLRVWR